MAQRYGGTYSPGQGTTPSGGRPGPRSDLRVDPVGARSNVLFLPPILLGLTSLGGGAIGLASGMLGAASLLLGAWLLRDGLRAEAAYADRKVARRPAIPRKIFAAGLAGIGTAVAAWSKDPAVAAPVIYGAVAGALHLGAFGIDPLSDKRMEGADDFQQARVLRAVDEAEAYLAAMKSAAARSGDRIVQDRVDGFAATARTLIRTVESDPRDLSAARRYLGVYLMGARDAAEKFAEVQARSGATSARAEFLTLLDDLEESFGRKTETLLIDDTSDLTVEIDVLRDRLRREGVHLDRR